MPGTFQPATDNHDTQRSSDSTEENVAIDDSVSTTTIESTTEVSFFAVGGTLFYTAIGVGGGIFFSFTIIVCMLTGFLVKRKRKLQAFITDTTLDQCNDIQMQGRCAAYSM